MVGQQECLGCPFCDKGVINCLYFAGAWSVKRSGRNSLGKGLSVSKSAGTWVVQSGCSYCGKTSDEVEKKFREVGFP